MRNDFTGLAIAALRALRLIVSNAMSKAIIAAAGPDSRVAQSIGSDFKGLVSVALYAAAVGFAFVNQWVSDAIYVTVALMWFIPDRRLRPT